MKPDGLNLKEENLLPLAAELGLVIFENLEDPVPNKTSPIIPEKTYLHLT